MQDHKIVWDYLSKSHLVEGELSKSEMESPWYIKVLLSISGWFGAFFFVLFSGGFIALSLGGNIEKFPLVLFFLGGGLLYFIYRVFQEEQSGFLEHFLLALSITGQAMVIISLFFMFDYHFNEMIMLFTIFFQAFLIWLIPNYMHKMMSSFFMASALSSFFYELGEPLLAMGIITFLVVWLWMNEFNFEERQQVEAIAYGQTIALFSLKYSMLGTSFYFYQLFGEKEIFFNFWWIESVTLATFLYVIWMILKEREIFNDKKVFILLAMAVVFLAILSFNVGGLALSFIFLMIGFAHSHRILMGLGIISALTFLSHYYYYLGETLMDKAGVLALMGLLLLLGRWIMKMVLEKEVLDV